MDHPIKQTTEENLLKEQVDNEQLYQEAKKIDKILSIPKFFWIPKLFIQSRNYCMKHTWKFTLNT